MQKAQYNLGLCYKNGFGVDQNLNIAIEFLTNAAEQGNAKAQYNLGYLYLTCNEEIKGFEWVKKAVEQGLDDAQKDLGVCYYNGLGVDQDILEGVKWFIKAKDQGHEDAMNILQSIFPGR